MTVWNSKFNRFGNIDRIRTAIRVGFITLMMVVIVVSTGCANGTYPLDIFYEMHYQQSYESHEPPRLTIPSSAISVDGVAPQTNENPIKGHRLEDGAKLFVSNCLFCHGADGKGDGPVLRIMKADYGYGTDENPYAITPDLTAQFVKDQSDLSIFGWITNGVTVMPSFDQLLSAEERWLLVNYIRFLGD